MSKIKVGTIKSISEILQEFDKKRNKSDILWEALDYMQQYNGRSKIDCVAFAMGYAINTGENTYIKQ